MEGLGTPVAEHLSVAEAPPCTVISDGVRINLQTKTLLIFRSTDHVWNINHTKHLQYSVAVIFSWNHQYCMVRRGSVMVRRDSVMVRRGSDMVRRGSVGWCGVAQLVARRLAGRQARVRFSARHHREVYPHWAQVQWGNGERPRRMAMDECMVSLYECDSECIYWKRQNKYCMRKYLDM